jgi:hypothetical protein
MPRKWIINLALVAKVVFFIETDFPPQRALLPPTFPMDQKASYGPGMPGSGSLSTEGDGRGDSSPPQTVKWSITLYSYCQNDENYVLIWKYDNMLIGGFCIKFYGIWYAISSTNVLNTTFKCVNKDLKHFINKGLVYSPILVGNLLNRNDLNKHFLSQHKPKSVILQREYYCQ